MPHKELLNFASFEVLPHVVIGEVFEGVSITVDHVKATLLLAARHFGNDPWVYISKRTNTYQMDPTVFPAFGDRDFNLVGFGLVSTRDVVQAMGRFESGFMLDRIHFKGFVDVDSAVDWANGLLQKT